LEPNKNLLNSTLISNKFKKTNKNFND